MKRMTDLRYEEALFYASNGEALLFYGAGFSSLATSISGKKMPVGTDLTALLSAEIDIEISDLGTASEAFTAIRGNNSLIEFLKDTYLIRDNDVPIIYKEIANINWKTIYTTNYDNVLEVAGNTIGKKYKSLTPSFDTKENKTSSNTIFHINGYIDYLNSSVADDIFKLTEKSYLNNQFRKSPWASIFFRDLLAAKAIFIVGYSLYDIDIKEILYHPSLKSKCFFVKSIRKKAVSYEPLLKFGQVLYIGIEKFAEDLKNIQENAGINSTLNINQLINFHKISINSNIQEDITDNDVFNFLMRGEVKDNIFIDNVLSNNRNNFIINRFEENEIISKIDDVENIIILGDIASGKSVLANVVSIKLASLGYEVFNLKSEVYDCFDEIDLITTLKGKVAIIIDNYTSRIDELKYIIDKRSKSLKLILTSKNFNHNKIEQDLYFASKILDIKQTYEIDISTLDIHDITKFLNLLSQYGIQTLGTEALQSQLAIEQYIKTKGNSELSSILLEFLKSPQIQNKIQPIFVQLNLNDTWLKAVVAIYLLGLMDKEGSFRTIITILDDSSIFRLLDIKSEELGFLIKQEGQIYSSKSSIFALYFFKNFNPSNKIIKILIDIAINCRKFEIEDKTEYQYRYKDIYNRMASFSFIQSILPEQGKLSLLIKYYENLRTLEVERKNPHFWLQYAMARLAYYGEQSNLRLAGEYLATAFSLASKMKNHYRITDIQTQYARFLLLRALTENEKNFHSAFDDFIEAKKLLTIVIKQESNKKEAYRPARSLEKFLLVFKNELDPSHLDEIYSLSKFILEAIYKSPYYIKDDTNIQYIQKSLTRILQKNDIKG